MREILVRLCYKLGGATVYEDYDEYLMDEYYNSLGQQEYEEELLDESLKRIQEGNIREYLWRFGKAIEQRISECLRQAQQLHDLGYYGPAIILSSTASEMVLGYLLVRPLVQGAVLSEEWADILVERISNSRRLGDFMVLQKILMKWGIDLNHLCLASGAGLWSTMVSVRNKRNRIVHRGELLPTAESTMVSELAVECVRILLNKVVQPIASTLGFKVVGDNVGWDDIEEEQEPVCKHIIEPIDPFAEREKGN
jgi:hypothetical protein